MLISKNVNNDVGKDLPITEATEMIQMINPGLKQSLLSCVRKTFLSVIYNPFTPETFLQIHISCTLRPYDLTRETPMKLLLKDRLHILSKFFAIIARSPSYLNKREFLSELKRGDCARVQTGMVEFIALLFPFSSKLKT